MKTANLINTENSNTFLSTLAAYSEDQFEKQGLIADAFCAAERTPVRLPADTRRRQRTAL